MTRRDDLVALLRATLRELITEQSEGEWDSATIEADVEVFLPRILALIPPEPAPMTPVIDRPEHEI
jgi:hypothetical protein